MKMQHAVQLAWTRLVLTIHVPVFFTLIQSCGLVVSLLNLPPTNCQSSRGFKLSAGIWLICKALAWHSASSWLSWFCMASISIPPPPPFKTHQLQFNITSPTVRKVAKILTWLCDPLSFLEHLELSPGPWPAQICWPVDNKVLNSDCHLTWLRWASENEYLKCSGIDYLQTRSLKKRSE